MERKLGKLPPRIDRRTLKFAKFIDFKNFPPIPDELKWSEKVSKWTMMKNDEIGDCAIAGKGHIIQTWSANESEEIILSDDEIVDAYSKICGYDPADSSTDGGCVMMDVLHYWRTIGVQGHKIEGFVSVNPKNRQEIMAAIYLFGAIYIGLELPLYIQDKEEWTTPENYADGNMPGSWGGHAVCVVDYDQDYLYVVTWGKLLKMSWKFFQIYCDEAYAVWSPDDWATDGTAPNGFDIAQLRKDLNNI